jgi:hypothetical protein
MCSFVSSFSVDVYSSEQSRSRPLSLEGRGPQFSRCPLRPRNPSKSYSDRFAEADIIVDHRVRSDRDPPRVGQIEFAENDLVTPDLAEKILENLDRQLFPGTAAVAETKRRKAGIVADRLRLIADIPLTEYRLDVASTRFMTRRRGGDFCPPKTDLESGCSCHDPLRMKSAARFREIFLRQVSRRPSWRGRCQWRRRVRRAGQRAKEQAFASHTWNPFTCEFRLRVCPISSKAAAMSAVRFLKGRWPHLPSRLRARQIPG